MTLYIFHFHQTSQFITMYYVEFFFMICPETCTHSWLMSWGGDTFVVAVICCCCCCSCCSFCCCCCCCCCCCWWWWWWWRWRRRRRRRGWWFQNRHKLPYNKFSNESFLTNIKKVHLMYRVMLNENGNGQLELSVDLS